MLDMGDIEVPEELVPFLETGVGGWLATCNKAGVPETTRVTGADVGRKKRSLTLYVPIEQAGKTFENLRENRRLAIFFVRVSDYRAVQVKGDLLEMRECEERQRARVTRYMGEFTEACVKVGVARDVMNALQYWPVMAVEMSVTDLFSQSPGPDAGARWR